MKEEEKSPELAKKEPQQTKQPHKQTAAAQRKAAQSQSQNQAQQPAAQLETPPHPNENQPTTPTEEERQESDPLAEEQDKSSLLKIQTVATDLNRLQSEIRQLHETADKLDNTIVMTENENYELVSKMQKKCLLFTEELMKNLLNLDSLVNLSQSSRPLRKQQVKRKKTEKRNQIHLTKLCGTKNLFFLGHSDSSFDR